MNYFVNNDDKDNNNNNNYIPKLDNYHGDNINQDLGNLEDVIKPSNEDNLSNTTFFTDYGKNYINNKYINENINNNYEVNDANNNENIEDLIIDEPINTNVNNESFSKKDLKNNFKVDNYDNYNNDVININDNINTNLNNDNNNPKSDFNDYFEQKSNNDDNKVILDSKKKNKKNKIFKIIIIILISLILLILALYFLPIPIIVTLNGNGVTEDKKAYCFGTIMDFKCDVTLNKIETNDNKKYIYNTEPDNHKMMYTGGQEISIDKWFTLYVVEEEKLTYSANFIKNGSTLSKEVLSCEGYASDGGCSITFPTIKRSKYTILGFSTNKDSKTAEYTVGQTVKLTEKQSTYYAITKRELKALFYAAESKNATNTKQVISCNVFNEETKCTITVPQFEIFGKNYGKYDTTFARYYNKNTLASYVKTGDSLTLSTSSSLIDNTYSAAYYSYVISKSNSLEMNSNWIEKIDKLGNTNIVYDKTCSAKSSYETFMNTLYQKAPYLFNTVTSIHFYGRSNFNKTIGNYQSVVGITYENSILISCDNTTLSSFDYNVIVHEMAHAQHNRLFTLTKESTFLTRYNTLRYKYYYTYHNRPLRSYAYTSDYEFIAELFSYYYTTTYLGYTSIEGYNSIDTNLTNEAKKLECAFKATNLSVLNKCY